MMTWGIGILSLSFLLIAYQNFLMGFPLLILAVVMILVARKNKKKEEKNKKI